MTVGMCRLCASLRKLDSLTMITDDGHDLYQQIKVCCHVEILFTDVLPKSVCDLCVQSLQTAYGFYTKAQESQESLNILYSMGSTGTTTAENNSTKSLMNNLNSAIRVEGTEKSVKYKSKKSGESDKKQDNEEIISDVDIDEINTNVFNEVLDMLDMNENDRKDEIDEVNESSTSNKRTKTTNDRGTREKSSVSVELNMDDEDENDDDIYNKDGNKSNQYINSVKPLLSWKEYVWHCYLCSESFESQARLEMHAKKLHKLLENDVQYKCTDCQKVCSRYYTFLNHIRLRHHPDLLLRCDVCDELNKTNALLAHHRARKCSQSGYPDIVQCSKCPKGFNNEISLQAHYRTQHSSVRLRYKCSVCGREFKRSGALKVHKSVHTDIKGFTCELCGRGFRQKTNLDVHMYSHINDKLFECLVCKKNFKTAFNLEKHTLVHTGIKNFKCDYCDKTFRTKSSKISHERTHTGEMPYKCGHCDKSFRYRSTLQSHTYMHTGERPYSCKDCNHFFTNWSNWNKHMKRRHPNAIAATKPSKDTASVPKDTSSSKFVKDENGLVNRSKRSLKQKQSNA